MPNYSKNESDRNTLAGTFIIGGQLNLLMLNTLKSKQEFNVKHLTINMMRRGTKNRLHLAKGLILSFVLMLAHTSASAADPIYTPFLNNDAMSGYDAISYFQNDEPIKGSEKFKTEYKGANWLFSSEENLQVFKADPEKYAPQYGGYCAYAAAHNQTAKGDPLQYQVSDGKLYLNFNADVRQRWLKDKANFIVQADKYWPALIE